MGPLQNNGGFTPLLFAVRNAHVETAVALLTLHPYTLDFLSAARGYALMLAFLGFQVLFTADTVFVGMWFSKADKDAYVAAGTLSRALMWLVLPLAAVMFPRIVQSAARAEKTNLIGLVLAGTGILAVLGAVSLSVLGPWIVRIVYKHSVDVAISVLPWYAAAMVPLALSNVLLNELFAKPAKRIVPAVLVLALAGFYLVALTQFHARLVNVLQTLGLFNLVLLAITGWFAWRARRERPATVEE